jgi:hypothetical protein
MYKTKYLLRYLQVFTQIAMNNNPSSKRVGVVFFALLRQSFVHSTPKPDTQASAIYIENISRKSEDREQFNSVQENCDEVVQIESENQEY